MKTPRMLVPDSMDGLYHVVSRVVDRRQVFGEPEKQRFRELLVAYAGFSGIQVVAWCLMDNHFHLLLRVPSKSTNDPALLPEEEILRRVQLIYGVKGVRDSRRILASCPSPESRRKYLEKFTRRMGDLGLMMKSVKQRFSTWFNKVHDREGTLWQDRYRSVIVEVDAEGTLGHAARVVAAYIDLNPVRAAIVDDPKDYKWCGYARALVCDHDCASGILSLWGTDKGLESALAKHRLFLFEKGSAQWMEKDKDGRTVDSSGKPRAGIDARKVLAERKRGGSLPLATILRLKSRYLVDGGVVGSPEFVERVTAGGGSLTRAGNSGVPMQFGEWGGLHVLRKLRKNLVGG